MHGGEVIPHEVHTLVRFALTEGLLEVERVLRHPERVGHVGGHQVQPRHTLGAGGVSRLGDITHSPRLVAAGQSLTWGKFSEKLVKTLLSRELEAAVPDRRVERPPQSSAGQPAAAEGRSWPPAGPDSPRDWAGPGSSEPAGSPDHRQSAQLRSHSSPL